MRSLIKNVVGVNEDTYSSLVIKLENKVQLNFKWENSELCRANTPDVSLLHIFQGFY